MAKYKGRYILAVEGNPPLNEDGMFCIQSGQPFLDKLKKTPPAPGWRTARSRCARCRA